MIQPFIDRFQEIKEDLLKDLAKNSPVATLIFLQKH